MQKIRAKNWFSRMLVLAVALLISNIAALSCAMAAALCSDCPEPTPVVCFDACGTELAAANDKPSDSQSSFKPVIRTRHQLSTVATDTHFAMVKMAINKSIAHDPPLNLLHCVFLK